MALPKIEKPAPKPAPKPAAPPPPKPPATMPKPAFKPDELSKGKGFALRRDATAKLGANIPSAPMGAMAKPAAHAAGATGIDRSNLSFADNAILDAMQVENLPPGGTTTLDVAVTAELSAIVGVEVGAHVTVSVSRDLNDPNVYTFAINTSAKVEPEVTGGTTSENVEVSAPIEAGVGIEFEVDFSEPGAGMDLVGFAAHVGLGAMLPPAATAAVSLFESLPGVHVPGEPGEFLAEHLSAIEVGIEAGISEELSAIIGTGGKCVVDKYLTAGGRLEFNDDGSLTVTKSAGGGLGVAISAGGGAESFANATLEIGGYDAELVFSQSTTLFPGPPEKVVSQEVQAEITLGGQAAIATGEVKLTASIAQLLQNAPPDVVRQVTAALAAGDLQTAAAVLGQALSTYSFTANVEASAGVNIAGDAEVDPHEGGFGGSLGIDAGISQTQVVYDGTVTVDATGVTVEDNFLGYPGGDEVTWEEMFNALNGGCS